MFPRKRQLFLQHDQPNGNGDESGAFERGGAPIPEPCTWVQGWDSDYAPKILLAKPARPACCVGCPLLPERCETTRGRTTAITPLATAGEIPARCAIFSIID